MVENPFIKRDRIRKNQRAISQRNYDELAKLLARYTDDDDPEVREQVRQRTIEARKILDES